MFDFFLLPQGRDQNYHLYYACFVTDKKQPRIVSSGNPQASKQEGNNRFVLPQQRHVSNQQEIDYIILYVWTGRLREV